MSKVPQGSIYCTNCRKGLHNEYAYKGEREVELIKQRCKGESKCECKCLTHFLHNGRLTAIGTIPSKFTNQSKMTMEDFKEQTQELLDRYK